MKVSLIIIKWYDNYHNDYINSNTNANDINDNDYNNGGMIIIIAMLIIIKKYNDKINNEIDENYGNDMVIR